VTMNCKMTYYFGPTDARLIPGVGISASINWESTAGMFSSNASNDEIVTHSNGAVVHAGKTLEMNVTMSASGAEVPSYNCTTAFHFTDRVDGTIDYATNSLTWTCVSEPVPTWCMYLKLLP